MPIRGAIFDCDGTLVDSMPMWTQTCVGLLERYGVPDARRVFAEHESLDMDKKCYWYHDNLGIGESGEALYRELWRDVEREYRTSVQAFAGCKAFLEELRLGGVRMVIASSTPTELLRVALEAHGLLQYFDELVFAGDVGRGKEHPDVYVAAQQRLGTAREDTWVFEDAPFGIRSAARVGFPVVALLNDHDGRDEAFVARWATVVARGYDGLHAQTLAESAPHVLRALVVAGSPEPSGADLVRRLARDSDYVVAADGGVDVLMAAGVTPDAVCGDADSASSAAWKWAEAEADEVRRFPRRKDDTDLGLSIACASEKAERLGACLRLTLTCASGGRPDHALAVWGVLARNARFSPRVVEDGFECRVLATEGAPSWRSLGTVGMTVSLISLTNGTVASARGLRWELDRAQLALLSDMGVSNEVVYEDCEVECHAGALAVFVPKEHPESRS